jgi:cell fate regulator YaaT (PSP1 superfamily)
MPDVLGIRFKSCGKIYDFETNGIAAKEGDHVVVESDFGLSLGKVIKESRFIEKSERELKRAVRTATEEDFRLSADNKNLEKEAREFCVERIMARGLPMKLVGTETTLDRKRIVFYFTAEGRIDFRELVKDLASRFKTRIEMRQIGVRDEAKLVGGFGVCGRPICCKTFLTSFDPVSIKMAKKQEMVLNIGKLSGLCSRLMCCLRYEYDGDLAAISTDEDVPIQPDSAVRTVAQVVNIDKKPEVAPTSEEIEDEEDDESLPGETEETQVPGEAPAPQNQSQTEAQNKEDANRKKGRRRFKRRRFKKTEPSKEAGSNEQ